MYGNLQNSCLMKLSLWKTKIYEMKKIFYILSASVKNAMIRLRGKDKMRTQMFRAQWSRSKCMIRNFGQGKMLGEVLEISKQND